MSSYKWEDLTEYDGACDYLIPNEDDKKWREYFKGKRINRAAGICSGGEIGFFTLLPTVRSELVLVDHSLRPLGYAILKWLLVKDLGFKEAKNLICDNKRDHELSEKLIELKAQLPEVIRNKFRVGIGAGYGRRFSLRTYWSGIKDDEGKAFERKMDKITFVHGAMEALVDREPFDLFYMSNAQDEHNGNERSGLYSKAGSGRGYADPYLIQKLVKKGGWIACAGAIRGRPNGWTLEKREHAYGRGGGLGWTHCLYQVKEHSEKPKPKPAPKLDFSSYNSKYTANSWIASSVMASANSNPF